MALRFTVGPPACPQLGMPPSGGLRGYFLGQGIGPRSGNSRGLGESKGLIVTTGGPPVAGVGVAGGDKSRCAFGKSPALKLGTAGSLEIMFYFWVMINGK